MKALKSATSLSKHYTSTFRDQKTGSPPYETRDVIYKIHCKNCDFVYHGQTGRAVNTRVTEHKLAVRTFDRNSKITEDVYEHDHSMDFENIAIVSKARNYHKRLFLEAWYSLRDPNAGNDRDHVAIPNIYASLR